MDPEGPNHLPTSIEPIIEDLPCWFVDLMRQRGVSTCEQAYEFVAELVAAGGEVSLPEGVHRQNLEKLLKSLEKAVPDETRAHLEASRRIRWSKERPLGVLPPEKMQEVCPGKPYFINEEQNETEENSRKSSGDDEKGEESQ